MQHRTADNQRKARSALETLREMQDQTKKMLDEMALEVGTAEILRQNLNGIENAIKLIEEAYTLPLARAH